VSHKDKKVLSVSVDGFLPPGGTLNANDWLSVLPDFQSQIIANTHPDSTEPALPSFTTTDVVAAAAYSATLMRALQNFFSYEAVSLCGIPSITLLGSKHDWTDLRARFLRLAEQWMGLTPATCEWTRAVDQMLGQFESARAGQVDVEWWKSIFKYNAPGYGSGAAPHITGHIACLFPWDRYNEWAGLRRSIYSVSSGSGSVPVKWNYLGKPFNMTLWSGFAGVCTDESQERIAPAMGVAITYHTTERSEAGPDDTPARARARRRRRAMEL
jgi:hypothetical protein